MFHVKHAAADSPPTVPAMSSWPFTADLTPEQERLLMAYGEELRLVNQRVNLISRKDEDQVFRHHIGHCLAMAHRSFPEGSTIVDWGTGGGLPAIVLAILFPSISVVAVDSIQKKIRAVEHLTGHLRLTNIRAWNGRAEQFPDRFHISVSRATAPLKTLWEWHQRRAFPARAVVDDYWPDGLLCLKGGDLTEEIAILKAAFRGLVVEQIPLQSLTEDPYFETKALVHVSHRS
jgi:16S rRNA (guanine527-N7)-methyltransferase